MKDTAKFLGAGVANIINVLNPEMVVIAGGVTRAGDHLFIPLRAEVRRRAFRTAEERCRIVSGAAPRHRRRGRRGGGVQEGENVRQVGVWSARRAPSECASGALGTAGLGPRLHPRAGLGGRGAVGRRRLLARALSAPRCPAGLVGAPRAPGRGATWRRRRRRLLRRAPRTSTWRGRAGGRRSPTTASSCATTTPPTAASSSPAASRPGTGTELEPAPARPRRPLRQLPLRLRAGRWRRRERLRARLRRGRSTPTCTRSSSARPATGPRAPRALPTGERWLALLRRRPAERDGARAAARRRRGRAKPSGGAPRLGPGSSLVTLGRARASRFAAAAARRAWRERGAVAAAARAARSPGDPTGCGDVWGGVVCAALLAGAPLAAALERAHRAAAAKIRHPRTDGPRARAARRAGRATRLSAARGRAVLPLGPDATATTARRTLHEDEC